VVDVDERQIIHLLKQECDGDFAARVIVEGFKKTIKMSPSNTSPG
jgi:hypothetical protein